MQYHKEYTAEDTSAARLSASAKGVRQFQEAVITNNTHVLPLQGEDYQVWELDLPGENTTGFNCTEIGDKPAACWWNLNAGWSYQPWHHKVKNAEEILEIYQAMQAQGAVFLLNVGPRPFGDIHPEEQQVLRALGGMVRGGELG